MENTKNYAESPALEWCAEDFDNQVIAGSEDGQIIQFNKDYFLSLSEDDKLKIIQEAISNVQSEVCELILSAIYDEVLENAQWVTQKTENNG
jgi:hypothetical protein